MNSSTDETHVKVIDEETDSNNEYFTKHSDSRNSGFINIHAEFDTNQILSSSEFGANSSVAQIPNDRTTVDLDKDIPKKAPRLLDTQNKQLDLSRLDQPSDRNSHKATLAKTERNLRDQEADEFKAKANYLEKKFREVEAENMRLKLENERLDQLIKQQELQQFRLTRKGGVIRSMMRLADGIVRREQQGPSFFRREQQRSSSKENHELTFPVQCKDE